MVDAPTNPFKSDVIMVPGHAEVREVVAGHAKGVV